MDAIPYEALFIALTLSIVLVIFRSALAFIEVFRLRGVLPLDVNSPDDRAPFRSAYLVLGLIGAAVSLFLILAKWTID